MTNVNTLKRKTITSKLIALYASATKTIATAPTGIIGQMDKPRPFNIVEGDHTIGCCEDQRSQGKLEVVLIQFYLGEELPF